MRRREPILINQQARLTNAESALLIALPQAPEARRPDRRQKAAKQSRDDYIAKTLYKRGRLSRICNTKKRLETEIPNLRYQFPSKAWLTGSRLQQKHAEQNGSKNKVQLRHTAIQSNVAHLAKKQYGIALEYNVSVLVIENATMKVRAHIGSAGRDRPGGWIDMASRPRSPGSTLKPFIYGFAFDDGISAPGSFILDIPTTVWQLPTGEF